MSDKALFLDYKNYYKYHKKQYSDVLSDLGYLEFVHDKLQEDIETATVALGETSTTAYRGDRGKTAYDHSQLTSGNPHNVTASDVGLGNVEDTSDLDKPISTATQGALDSKASDSDLTDHTSDQSNPHAVNKSDVGLGNVPNTDFTSDVNTNTAKRSYPLADENKLAGIEAGAQVNVKTDWAETDPNSDKFLENKPVGYSGSFEDANGQIVTVDKGIITSIV